MSRFEEAGGRRLEGAGGWNQEGLASISLHPTLLRRVEGHQLSEHHRAIVQGVLTGRDLMVVDREGVEVALLLPIVHRMLEEEAPSKCLVVTQTEEEVERFCAAADNLVEGTDIICRTTVHGLPYVRWLQINVSDVMVTTMDHFKAFMDNFGDMLLRESKYFVMTGTDAGGRERGLPEEVVRICTREAMAGLQAILVAGDLPGNVQDALRPLLNHNVQLIQPTYPADSGLETDIANIKLVIEEDEKDMEEICKKMEDVKTMKEEVKAMQKELQEKEAEVEKDLERLKKKRVVGSLIEFLLGAIARKKGDLECPVCLDEASPPIYCCSQFHLVCAACRADERLDACPTCRERFEEGESRRQRFAEREAEELARLRAELTRLTS